MEFNRYIKMDEDWKSEKEKIIDKLKERRSPPKRNGYDIPKLVFYTLIGLCLFFFGMYFLQS